MFIRAKYVLQFSRRNDRQNTAIDPAIENRRIVWTFMFEAAGRKVACENSRPSSLLACECRRISGCVKYVCVRRLLRSRPEWRFTAVFEDEKESGR